MATRPKKARTVQQGQYEGQQDMSQPTGYEQESPKPERAAKSDGSSSFLRAARAGNLDKVVDLLKSGKADIATCNANGLNALHLAAKEGHINIVNELLARGADVDAATKKGNTAMHIASLAGQLEIVKILVQNGAKINTQSQTGFTPLYMAAQENHLPVVKYLIDKNANSALATEDGFTPMAVALQQGHTDVVNALMEYNQKGRVRLSALHVAAKKDDTRTAALLLQNDQNAGNASKGGGMVNETTKSDFTPLHIAAHYGNANIAGFLIEKGANINFKAKNGITPLHVSSKWGRKNVVALLLDNNANVEAKTRDGLTALHCAARSGHDLVVDQLLERGAPVSAKTRNGLTALHMAAQGDHVDCARILIFHRAPVDDVTVDYLTPLHVAAHCGNVAVAKLLLDRKCQVDARALNGFTPLHIACKKNRIKVIELLLQYGAHINSTTESGLTPLHVASFMGHLEIVSFLLQQGCDPNAPTVRGETSLHLATRGNQTEVLKLLLRNGAQVDAKAKEQQTALHVASRLGSVECVTILLNHDASPDAATVEQYTPLHIAAKEGHEEVVQVLLDRGANHKIATVKGFTPLHIAAKYGTSRVARVLLKKGADPNSEGKNGLTPLHVASHYNHPAMVNLLLESRANPHATAKNGYTPLHIAAKKDEIDIATALLEYGAKSNAESKNGFTPLHLATQEGHTDMVTLLLERKAQVNARAKNGLTAMHLAAQEDHVPVAEILVKYKSNIDQQTKAGYTPLHTACHFGQLNMIRFLLDHGASVSSTTKLGYTPLHQAAQQGHVLVINLLLRYNADPNTLTTTGESPLSISEQLGYISVVEILKQVTQVIVTTTATDKYKLMSPEIMQEAAMSDEDDDGDEQLNLADQSYQYQYLTTGDDMRGLQDDGTGHSKDQDLFAFERASGRHSTTSSVGRQQIQDELRYTTEPDETLIDSTAMRDLQYTTMTQQQLAPPEQLSPGQVSPGVSSGQRSPVGDQSSPLISPKYYDDKMDIDAGQYKGGTRPAWDDHLKQYTDDDLIETQRIQLTSTEITRAVTSVKTKPTVLDVGKPRVNGVDIIVTDDNMQQLHEAPSSAQYLGTTPMSETVQTPTDFQTGGLRGYKSNMSETDSRMYGSSSAMSYASSFDPDNVALRHPVYSGFLVSFLVDARGGAMRGCRHSGIRIIIPPLKLCQPTRITCKLVRRDKVAQMPPLMEGEVLASRILVMGPAGVKFTGPVVLEVPHFAALHGREREIMVLRSENGQTWREHAELATEQTVQNMLCGSFEDLESAEDLYQRRITRIITSDFPKYFAIVTRIRQDSSVLGPDGGVMTSTVVPQVQVIFPPGALTKSIKVGLQSQAVSPELVAKILGPKVYVGPIVTIEPRRRKFHKPITVTLPLPSELQSAGKQTMDLTNTANLRLLCSITGGTDATEWEDITGSTLMTLVNNGVSFVSTVSARFWLMYCPTPSEVVPMSTRLYAEAIVVPFMANFVVFAKRRNDNEAQLRMFCMTDDKIDKTLESQEHFREVARSRDIEVLDGKRQYIDVSGNLVTVVKPTDPSRPDPTEADTIGGEKQLYINFRAFHENRRHVNVRVWDATMPPVGTAVFLAEPLRVERNQTPICVLTVSLSETEEGQFGGADAGSNVSADTADLCRKLAALQKTEDDDQISKAQLRLTDIAEYLEGDWVILAKQLGITRDEIMKIQSEYHYVVEQALVMLHLWVEKNKDGATGNALERALKYIRREDIIHKCIRVVEEVTDVREKVAARAQLISSDDGLRPEDGDLTKTPPSTPAEPQLAPLHVSHRVTEAALVESIKRKSAGEVDMSRDSLEPYSAKPQRQTFEDWALETTPAAVGRTASPRLPTPASPKPPEFLETAFEDWVQQREMTSCSPTPMTPPPSHVESMDDIEAGAAEVLRETIEGDLELRVELDDNEETRDDGTTIRRQIVTRRRVCPVSEILVIGGVATDCKTTDRVIDIEIDEDVLVLPPGVDSPDFSDNLRTSTSVAEFQESSPDGIPVLRRVVTTTVLPAGVSSPSDELSGPERLPEPLSDIERRAQEMVNESIEAALHEVKFASQAEQPTEADDDVDNDTAMLRVYTDTLEGEPEVETDVQETEETLPDGTVIRRRVTKTKQKQTIIKRVVMEGPEDELPATEEEAQQFLQQTKLDVDDDDVIHRYGDPDIADVTDEPSTNVQEYEEVLEDGTVVKRRVVTTTTQQLTTERVVLEGDSGDEYEASYDDYQHGDQAFEAAQPAAVSGSEENGASDGEEDDTMRVVMKKEIRRQRIRREDGTEETVITEDVHVVQQDEEPEELETAMQNVVDQFMGRSHSGQSSV